MVHLQPFSNSLVTCVKFFSPSGRRRLCLKFMISANLTGQRWTPTFIPTWLLGFKRYIVNRQCKITSLLLRLIFTVYVPSWSLILTLYLLMDHTIRHGVWLIWSILLKISVVNIQHRFQTYFQRSWTCPSCPWICSAPYFNTLLFKKSALFNILHALLFQSISRCGAICLFCFSTMQL